MATETEKKFLIKNENWRKLGTTQQYCQGYLSSKPECTIRIRITGDKSFLTIKGENTGDTRLEFEYEIPAGDASEMLQTLCHKPLIEKNRTKIPHKGFIWEVDEFFGENKGLILAEIELEHTGQTFQKPDWIGEEVTDDPRYYNSNLVTFPYSLWGKEEQNHR